jgi:sugar/nucleoside kinase (ribokinase family)
VDALLDWLPSVAGKVLLDPSPLVADISWDRILPYVDILSCNAHEAESLPTVDIPMRIMRDGPNGCTVNGVHIPGFPVQAVDTNGAGDTHCGVLIAELLRGNDIETAAKRANAAAAISVTRRGPATAPRRPEIDELTQTSSQPN